MRRLLLGLVVLWIMGGCARFETTPDRDTPTGDLQSSQVEITDTATTIPSDTPVVAFTIEPEETPVPEVDVPTVAPDPLVFNFPTSGPAPVSAWRPPLYPVPWAPTAYDHFYFSRPIAADEVNWPLANYRYGGVFFENVVHTGVDIPVRRDTPVFAAGKGKVIWADWGLYRGISGDLSDPYGIAVVIKHDFGYQGQDLYTVYGHLNRADVVRGQWVEKGDLIGLSGDTGKVTGPHLHFEVRVGEMDFFETYNPELWMVPPQGWGLIAGRVMDTSGQLYPDETLLIQSEETRQIWKVIPYGGGAANSDPYYQENLVIGDLPAGWYTVTMQYAGRSYELELEVYPGRVSYFTFSGRDGFETELPEAPGTEYEPTEVGQEGSP